MSRPFSIRRAIAGDEPTLRALRLEALTDAPDAFGSTYERELARTTADWQRWLSPSATFILEVADAARGLVAGMHDDEDRMVVHLRAMWIHPSLRRMGAADALVAAVVAWAAEEAATEVRLRVAKGNDRARRCYERNGFRTAGSEVEGPRSGLIEVEMWRSVR